MKLKTLWIVVAALVMLCLTACAQKREKKSETDSGMQKQKVLVAYFSATGTTKSVAERIAKATGGDLYEIAPETPYTDDDLDWRNDKSRSSVEMHCDTIRPALKALKTDMEGYDVVFVGFPIWWNLAPRAVNAFVEQHNLQGKVLVPFATSGGDDITNSVADLKKRYPELNWCHARLLNDVSDEELNDWIGTVAGK